MLQPNQNCVQALAEWNGRYEAKFGHIFIICATGKSAEEMLAAIQQRWAAAAARLAVAAGGWKVDCGAQSLSNSVAGYGVGFRVFGALKSTEGCGGPRGGG